VWSKTDRFYIKEYEEETNLGCTIVLDCSKSMGYGGGGEGRGAGGSGEVEGGVSKYDYAATLGVSLAWFLQLKQDAVGLVTFDNEIRNWLPMRTNRHHIQLLTEELESREVSGKTDVDEVFKQLTGLIQRRGVVVLVSDLFVNMETFEEALRRFVHQGHEVIVFHVMHEDEVRFPFERNVLFRGMEDEGEMMTEPGAIRREYLEAVDEFVRGVRDICSTAGVDYVGMNTSEKLETALGAYLAFRQRSLRGARYRVREAGVRARGRGIE